jgi:hypothetical protein
MPPWVHLPIHLGEMSFLVHNIKYPKIYNFALFFGRPGVAAMKGKLVHVVKDVTDF